MLMRRVDLGLDNDSCTYFDGALGNLSWDSPDDAGEVLMNPNNMRRDSPLPAQ